MDTEIIKGAISDVSYKDSFDADGIPYRKYTFKLDGKNLTCNLGSRESMSEGDMMIVEIKKNNGVYEMIAGLHTFNNYKWGDVSALKTFKNEDDNFVFAEGVIIEKRSSRKTGYSAGTPNVKYTLVFEKSSFLVSGYIGVDLKPGDFVSAVITGQFATLLYNKTTNKWYGVKFPYYIIFFILFLCFNVIMYTLITTHSEVVANPKGTTLVFDFFLVLFGIANFIGYRTSQAAKRFLKTRLSKTS